MAVSAVQALRYGAVTAAAVAVVSVMFARRPRPVLAPTRSTHPLRLVRVTTDDLLYQGQVLAHLEPRSLCEDSPCFTIDALYEVLSTTPHGAPHGAPTRDPAALDLDRLVIVELDAATDPGIERKVLTTVAAAGYEPVVRFTPDPYSIFAK